MSSTTTAASSNAKSLYRNLLRYSRLSNQTSNPTRSRSPPLTVYLRESFRPSDSTVSSSTSPASPSPPSSLPFGGSGSTSSHQTIKAIQIDNLATFLKHKKIHTELLERYNPTYGLTELERVRLTARRVGLDVPITVDRATTPTTDNYRQGAQIAADKWQEDKLRREDQLYSGKGDGTNRGGPLPPPIAKDL